MFFLFILQNQPNSKSKHIVSINLDFQKHIVFLDVVISQFGLTARMAVLVFYVWTKCAYSVCFCFLPLSKNMQLRYCWGAHIWNYLKNNSCSTVLHTAPWQHIYIPSLFLVIQPSKFLFTLSLHIMRIQIYSQGKCVYVICTVLVSFFKNHTHFGFQRVCCLHFMMTLCINSSLWKGIRWILRCLLKHWITKYMDNSLNCWTPV